MSAECISADSVRYRNTDVLDKDIFADTLHASRRLLFSVRFFCPSTFCTVDGSRTVFVLSVVFIVFDSTHVSMALGTCRKLTF